MKVAILTPLEPAGLGGVEKVVREFSLRLKSRFDIEILCSGSSAKSYEFEGIPTHVVKGRMGSFGYAPEVYDILEKIQPSLMYVHDYSSYMPYVAAKFKKRKMGKTKFVLHAHFHPKGSTAGNKLLRRVYDPVIGTGTVKEADGVIANSKSELAAIKSSFDIEDKQCFTIPNGIDLEVIERARSFDIQDGNIPILSAGRLIRYKNPIEAIRVTSKLPPKFNLYMAGKGPLTEELKALAAKLGVEKRVHLLGFVPDEDVYAWYKTAHCFLHLSDFESFGLTCIEALAAGTPSVANDDGFGLSDTIDLFPEYILRCKVGTQTPEQIANLVEKSSRMKPVKANVLDFGWDALSSKLANAFESVMAA
jgi:glycosyltransferase involved in cell wall biosynthesis